jgi:hypothetical protein
MPKNARPQQTGPSLFEEATGNGGIRPMTSFPPTEPIKEVLDGTLDDSEFDIPAFIRRKMK